MRASGTALGIKGLRLPEGMAQVQIWPSVNDYQELLCVCLCEYVEQRRLGGVEGGFAGLNASCTFQTLTHICTCVHTSLRLTCLLFRTRRFFFFLRDGGSCMPKNADPPQSNRPAPKRSTTTGHRNISSSFATNTLNQIKYIHTQECTDHHMLLVFSVS